MPLNRKTVPGTIVRFEKRDGSHYPFVRFATRDGQVVERLWNGHSAEERGLQTDAAALLRLAGYVVQVAYDTANPEYFDVVDWESSAVFAAPQTSMNFSITPKSKKSYLLPYKLILVFLVLFIVIGNAIFLFSNNNTKAASALLNLLAQPLFFAGYVFFAALLLYVLQVFIADSERVMVKDDVIYHYRCRNGKSAVKEHRYSRILHVDRVIVGRQMIRVYGEIEQVVNTVSHRRKTYHQQSKTNPYRDEHDEVLAYQQSDSSVPDSDKLIFSALNDPTGKKRTVKVSRLTMRKTMEHADFLTEKLRAIKSGQSANGINT